MSIIPVRAAAGRRIRTGALVVLVAVAAAPWLAAPQPARAATSGDAVLDWNRHALDVLAPNASSDPVLRKDRTRQAPTVAVQHLAMVHGAVYDAVNAIDGGHQPYLGVELEPDDLPVPLGQASTAAAAATAAHDVLTGVVMLPALSDPARDRLRALLDASLAEARTQQGQDATDAGFAVGRAAAAAMLDERREDGRYGTFRFAVGDGLGEWRPTTEGANDPAGWVARVEPFTLESTSQFRTKGPHALTSGAYAQEYQEVQEYGRKEGSARTSEQTALALFHTAHPPEMFNGTFRDIAVAQGLSLVEQARLFAMLNMAGADALINCWDDKAFWGFWRPITAIQASDDGNRRTSSESTWTSLSPAPPYPDHPSGYSCVTGAFMYTAQSYFGAGPLPFDLRRLDATGHDPRHYTHFRDAVDDVVDARMLLGIHFRSANEQGAALGRDVAQWVAKNHFRPVGQ